MLFNRSLYAIVALFVLALPAIAMDADVEPLTQREVQEIFGRGQVSCANDGKIGRDKYDPQYVSCQNIRQLLVPDRSSAAAFPPIRRARDRRTTASMPVENRISAS